MRASVGVITLASCSAFCLWFALGCTPPEGPAAAELHELGSYQFEGTLQSNGCGRGAVPALDPVEFGATLFAAEGYAAWQLNDGPRIYGTVRADQSWRFGSEQVLTVFEPDPTQNRNGCALIQTELVTLNDMPMGSPDASLAAPETVVGESSIEFTPTTGSDCRPSISSFGGPFIALPCQLKYELRGSREARSE